LVKDRNAGKSKKTTVQKGQQNTQANVSLKGGKRYKVVGYSFVGGKKAKKTIKNPPPGRERDHLWDKKNLPFTGLQKKNPGKPQKGKSGEKKMTPWPESLSAKASWGTKPTLLTTRLK